MSLKDHRNELICIKWAEIDLLDEKFCFPVHYKHGHEKQLILSYEFDDIDGWYMDQAVDIVKHSKLLNKLIQYHTDNLTDSSTRRSDEINGRSHMRNLLWKISKEIIEECRFNGI
jgi:hypothetical protein